MDDMPCVQIHSPNEFIGVSIKNWYSEVKTMCWYYRFYYFIIMINWAREFSRIEPANLLSPII